MYNFYLGIFFSFIYSILVVISTFSKNKSNMLKIQTFDQFFAALSHFFLYSYSAFIINIVNIIRNYLTSKQKLTKTIVLICILFYIVFGISFNTKGLIGIIPIIASSSYAVFCLKSNNSQTLRYGLILNLFLWLIHDIYISAYPSIMVDIIVSIFTMYNVVKYKKENNPALKSKDKYNKNA